MLTRTLGVHPIVPWFIATFSGKGLQRRKPRVEAEKPKLNTTHEIPTHMTHSWNPKANHFCWWLEMVISNHFLCKDVVHPIETTIYKWMAIRSQVPNKAKKKHLCNRDNGCRTPRGYKWRHRQIPWTPPDPQSAFESRQNWRVLPKTRGHLGSRFIYMYDI